MTDPTYKQLKRQLKAAQKKAATAEKKARAAEEKRAAAVEEVTALQGHIEAAYSALGFGSDLPLLPEATLLFMMKDDPDAAAVFLDQMEVASQRENPACDGVFQEYSVCLAHMTLLAKIPKDGAVLAIGKTIDLARQRLKEFHLWPDPDQPFMDYDYVTLTAVCIKAKEGCTHGANQLYDPRPDIDAITKPMKHLLPDVQEWIHRKHSKGSNVPGGARAVRRNPGRDARKKSEAKAALKKMWFPVTLTFLHELLRKEIAGRLVPLIAEDVLPVELIDMICAFCYDAEFIAQAPAIAEYNILHLWDYGD